MPQYAALLVAIFKLSVFIAFKWYQKQVPTSWHSRDIKEN